MRIHLAADHAGFELKEKVKQFLLELEYEVEDHGAEEFQKEDDYPDFIKPVAEAIAANPQEKGILFGGSGQGEAMVANRFAGVRAAVYSGGPQDIIRLSREHNDANMLSIGARFLSEEEALNAIKLWLELPFPKEERHQRRIDKIDN
ncbi:MAG: RpiB/LacA/LacB family sugar-phosphate isomerase [Candidatus Harrisonbacteria bacterium]|nr:RpiB/LacA/LacB family sugar-phosphate isomerase [Candidatus Harrisonbacteria bacterium]